MKEEDIKQLKAEIDIMAKLDHPNIVKLYEAYDTPKKTVLVLELVTGGELFKALVAKQSPYYEKDAMEILKNVLKGVEYMHSMGVCHRDLKPENLLIQGDDPRNVKITDFGLSKDFSLQPMVTSCGTASYAAPEVLMGKPYTSECDIWSVGVISFVLLSAEFPFYGKNETEIFRAILDYRYKFKPGLWDRNSDNAKDFIKQLFVPVDRRPNAEQCLQHIWFSGVNSKKKLISFSQKLSELIQVPLEVTQNSENNQESDHEENN